LNCFLLQLNLRPRKREVATPKPLKLHTILLSRMTLASAEAVTGIRGTDEVTSHCCSSVAPQGRRPVKERPSHYGSGIAGGAIESLSISSIRERVWSCQDASKCVSIERRIGTLYSDRSFAKSLLITLNKSRTSNPNQFTVQELAIGAYDLDQPCTFARKTVPSVQLLTVYGMHTQAVYTRRQDRQRQRQSDENKSFHLLSHAACITASLERAWKS